MMRAEKEQFVSDIKADVERALTVLFVDYTGMTVEEATTLRKKLREAEVGFRVVKNTLMKRAVAGTPYESVGEVLKGTPTGVVLGFDDPVKAAKLTLDFQKDNEHLKVKGGIFDKKAITSKEAEALSKMPSREELIAGIIGVMLGQGRRIAAQIKSPAGRVVGAIEAKAKKEEG